MLIFICTCVCVCVYIYIYIGTHTHTHTLSLSPKPSKPFRCLRRSKAVTRSPSRTAFLSSLVSQKTGGIVLG